MNSDISVSVAEAYERCIGVISPSAAMFLNDWMKHYPEEVILYAFQEAARKRITTHRYIEAIMANKSRESEKKVVRPEKFIQGKYSDMVVRTPEDVERIMARRKELNGG